MKRDRDKLLNKFEEIKEKEIKRKKIIKKEDSKEKKIKNEEKRKKREHYLINVGALFEIEGLLDEPPALLLGYLMQFHSMSIEQRKKLYVLGKTKLDKRESEKQNKELIDEKEIIELLKIAFNKKNVDPMREIYRLTKKRILETLTKKEFKKLIEYFSND